MTISELQAKKRILIIGNGIEGKAVYAFLQKHCPDVEVKIVDQKDGDSYLKDQHTYELAIKSPGVHPNLVTIPYTTATNIFFSNYKGKAIGITGTKGKSTTTALVYEMLKKQGLDVHVGGNIGQSPLDFLDTLDEQSWTVLELSSFQLQDIRKGPHIAVMLMVTSEHLDYHKTTEAYVDAKRNILRFQSKDDYAILNRDYPATNESDIFTDAKVFYVSRERETDEACFAFGGKVIIRKGGNDNEIINTKDILLPGKHNLENICAAVMAANLAGVSTKHIAEVLKTFKGLPHRLEFVAEKLGVQYYNDSLATIPEAALEAIEAFDGKATTLIAGGFDRGLDYSQLGEYLAKSSIKTLILFPPVGERIWKEVVAAGGEGKIKRIEVSSMHQAVFLASEETESGSVCLLSPAAASFGLFENYKDRGDQFKHEVLQLQ